MGTLILALAGAASLYDWNSGVWRIALDPSEEPMLPADDPGFADYRIAVANFGADDLFVIAMQADDIFTSQNLHVLRDIGDRIRRIDGVRSVESIVETTVPSYDASRDMVVVGRYIDRIPTSADALAELRGDALSHPLFADGLLGRDGRTAAINVAMRRLTDGEYVEAGINERIDSILAEYGDDGRRFYVTGRQYIKAKAYHIMLRDLLTLIPLALLVGACVAWLSTGSVMAGVVPVLASAVAMLWVFAYLALSGAALNIITLVLGPVLLCIGSVYGVHIGARFKPTLPSEAAHAVSECVRLVRTPVALAGVTTMVGFAALSTSPTPAIRELSILSVLGIAAITAISLIALPGALSLTAKHGRVRPWRPSVAIDRVLAACRHVAVARSGATIGVWAVFCLLAVAAVPSIRVDTDYLSFFDTHSRIRTDFSAIGRDLVGPVPIYVSLHGRAPGTMREPSNLEAVRRLQRRIEAIPAVSATTSVVDLLEQANRAFERDAAAAAVLPDTKGAVADLYFLIPKTRIRPFANSDQSSANIVVRTAAGGSSAIRALEVDMLRAIEDAQLPADLTVAISGSSILLNHNADGIASNQFTAVAAAAVAIFFLVTWSLGSARLGALAMIPNVVPVLMFFGLLGAGAGTLSLPTSLLGCIALGIAVDDTAHFLVEYHRARNDGADIATAADGCIRTLGRPIVITSLMLSAGFAVLELSGFATLRELGRLAALTMFICLCADLTLLPALLVRSRA